MGPDSNNGRSVTVLQIEAEMNAEIDRVSERAPSSPTDAQLSEAFRLGADIGYNKTAVRQAAWRIFRGLADGPTPPATTRDI